jgi:hypothetical protein
MDRTLPQSKRLIPPNLHRDWVFWVGIVVVLIPFVRLIYYIAAPCSYPPRLFAIPEPVSYSELIAKQTTYHCGLVLELMIGLPICAMLLLILAKGRRRIAFAFIVASGALSLMMLGIAAELFYLSDRTVLIEKDTIEYQDSRYHIVEEKVFARGADIQTKSLLVFDCDLNDNNCYHIVVIPRFDDQDLRTKFSLKINEDKGWAELWRDDKRMFSLRSNQ